MRSVLHRRARAHVPAFGHPAGTEARWRRLVTQALRRQPTPFHLLAAEPIDEALHELRVVERACPVPVRHWLSCKTQPVGPLLRRWRRQGRPIEVVSEFELRAALAEGFPPERILVNGPAKHTWLPRLARPGLSVNFDSATELATLVPLARALDWRVGVRLLTTEEEDPETPGQPTPFGFEPAAAVAALRRLARARVRAETIHFHLRTHVAAAACYARALAEVAAVCQAAGFAPRHLDCGGGVPPPFTLGRDGRRLDRAFDLAAFGRVLAAGVAALPGVREVWLENGRFLLARAGVLVVRVLDVKERRGMRQLICDGGRTLHALVSAWESHRLFPHPRRGGPACLTAVHGPTCMAFDRLATAPLSRRVRVGDALVWMEAGAYHVPWETRFSHGHAAVLWHERGRWTRAREAERFEDWWGRWRAAG